MRTRIYIAFAALAAAAAGGMLVKGTARGHADDPPATAKDEAQADSPADRKADEAAVRQQSKAFADAFMKGDATALAGLVTPTCEYYDNNSGEEFHGRAAIRKAFAEFFKQHPKSKVEIDIASVRFLGKDTAVEEGLSRVQLPGPSLPSSAHYRVLHVREDGKWYVAMMEEGGGAEDKLEDLNWLLGSWSAKFKDREVRLNFAWNEKKSRIICHFQSLEGGKVTASGTQIIGKNPQHGGLHSWNFDDDGGHGESVWVRNGHRWIQESVGVLPDGAPTEANNIVTRLSEDELTWKSVGRTVAGQPVPDTETVKVKRVKPEKDQASK